MPIRRNRPTLYEMVSRSRRAGDSGWRRTRAPVRTAEAGPAGGSGQTPRMVRVANGRLYVELGWPGMLVVGVACLVILAVVFQGGVRYERTHAQAVSSAGLVEPPAESDLVEREPGKPPRETEPAPPVAADETVTIPRKPTPGPGPREHAFKSGYHYVVVQHFSKKQQAQARNAAEFLRSHGIDCVLVRGKDIRLVAAEPFLIRQPDSAAAAAEKRRCEALKQRIRELGKEYFKQHGYAFERCYESLFRS